MWHLHPRSLRWAVGLSSMQVLRTRMHPQKSTDLPHTVSIVVGLAGIVLLLLVLNIGDTTIVLSTGWISSSLHERSLCTGHEPLYSNGAYRGEFRICPMLRKALPWQQTLREAGRNTHRHSNWWNRRHNRNQSLSTTHPSPRGLPNLACLYEVLTWLSI